MELTMIGKNGERYQLLVNTVPIIIDNQNLGLIGIAISMRARHEPGGMDYEFLSSEPEESERREARDAPP